MNDDLISRKNVIDILENMIFDVGKDLSKSYLLQDAIERINRVKTALDKEKVIEEIQTERKSMEEKGLFNLAIVYQIAETIIEKGGVEN